MRWASLDFYRRKTQFRRVPASGPFVCSFQEAARDFHAQFSLELGVLARFGA